MSSTAPLWRSISDELRSRAENGHYGDAFPGELAVAEEFSVSRGTARAALRPLREAGLVSAGRGRCPQIAQVDASSRFGAIYSLNEVISAAGLTPSSRVVRQHLTRDVEAASALGLDEDAELFHLERLRLADGRPFAHDEIFLPSELGRDLLEVDFTQAAFYEQLRDTCGVVIDGGTERTSAQSAGDALAELLHCSPATALLCIERRARSRGRSVEWRRTRFLADQFSAERPFGEPLHL